jgi:hypothetical protein
MSNELVRLRGVIARAAEELASLDDDAVGWLESFPFRDQPARRTATTILRARAILAEAREGPSPAAEDLRRQSDGGW